MYANSLLYTLTSLNRLYIQLDTKSRIDYLVKSSMAFPPTAYILPLNTRLKQKETAETGKNLAKLPSSYTRILQPDSFKLPL